VSYTSKKGSEGGGRTTCQDRIKITHFESELPPLKIKNNSGTPHVEKQTLW
jgi:hypothetical protein